MVNLIDFTKQDLPVSKVKIMKKKEDKMKKAVIAVPMGDPAGIGPEIVVKAVSKKEIQDIAKVVVIGDGKILEKAFM